MRKSDGGHTFGERNSADVDFLSGNLVAGPVVGAVTNVQDANIDNATSAVSSFLGGPGNSFG